MKYLHIVFGSWLGSRLYENDVMTEPEKINEKVKYDEDDAI